jgi:hypothetical protein
MGIAAPGLSAEQGSLAAATSGHGRLPRRAERSSYLCIPGLTTKPATSRPNPQGLDDLARPSPHFILAQSSLLGLKGSEATKNICLLESSHHGKFHGIEASQFTDLTRDSLSIRSKITVPPKIKEVALDRRVAAIPISTARSPRLNSRSR